MKLLIPKNGGDVKKLGLGLQNWRRARGGSGRVTCPPIAKGSDGRWRCSMHAAAMRAEEGGR